MNFNVQREEVMLKILKAKELVEAALDVREKTEAVRELNVWNGVYLWLETNDAAINNLLDFRVKINKLNSILESEMFVDMVGHLFAANTLFDKVKGVAENNEYYYVTSSLGIKSDLDDDSLIRIAKEKFGYARDAYDAIFMTDELNENAAECEFNLYFQFTNNCFDVDKLLFATQNLYDIADELENIYREINTTELKNIIDNM